MKPIGHVLGRVTALCAMVGAALLLVPGTASADTGYYYYWGAIAISPGTGNVAYSYDYPSAIGARNSAVNRCNAYDCQAVVVVANGCAAVAQARNLAWGWAYAATLGAAASAAKGATPGSHPRIVTYVCTTGHQ